MELLLGIQRASGREDLHWGGHAHFEREYLKWPQIGQTLL